MNKSKINIFFLSLFVFVLLISVSATAQNKTKKRNNQTSSLSEYLSANKSGVGQFSFAQFSDLLISDSNEENTTALQNAVDDVNDLGNVAFVLVSGNITDDGLESSLRKAKKILDKLICPYYVIPGDADLSNSSSGYMAFKRVFGDLHFRIQFNGVAFIGVPTASIINSSVGSIAPQEIKWAERQLKNIGKKTPIFMVTHRPMKNGMVDNWYELTDAVRHYNVQAFLNGYAHDDMMNNYDGIIGLISSSITSQKNSSKYKLFTLYSDSLDVFVKSVKEEAKLWGTFPIETKVYVEGNTKEFARGDFSVNSKNDNYRAIWSKNSGAAIYAPLSCNERYIYCADAQGTVSALDIKNGKMKWTFPSLGEIFVQPYLYKNSLIVASSNYSVYCVDAETGSLRWKKTMGCEMLATPMVYNDTILIGGNDKQLHALDFKTSEIFWTATLSSVLSLQPKIVDNTIICVDREGVIYAFDRSTHELQWQKSGVKKHENIVVDKNIIYAVDENGFLITFDCNSGSQSVVSQNNVYHNLFLTSAGLLVASSGRSIDIYSTKDSEFELVQSVDLNDELTAVMAEFGNKLLIASTDGKIYTVDLINGSYFCYKPDNVKNTSFIWLNHKEFTTANTRGYITKGSIR